MAANVAVKLYRASPHLRARQFKQDLAIGAEDTSAAQGVTCDSGGILGVIGDKAAGAVYSRRPEIIILRRRQLRGAVLACLNRQHRQIGLLSGIVGQRGQRRPCLPLVKGRYSRSS